MRRRRRIGIAGALVTTIGLAPTTAGAGPAATCTFQGGVLTVEEHYVSGNVDIHVWQDTDGSVWAVAGTAYVPTFCTGSPTVNSVRSIDVTGGPSSGTLIIWMTRSVTDVEPAPPVDGGPPADWSGVSWDVRLGSDRREKDALYVYATGARQGLDLTAGDAGIDLDGDGRLDVRYSSTLAKIGVVGYPGVAGLRNRVSMAGGGSTGGPVRIRTALGVGAFADGPTSTDIYIGGLARDLITGGNGSDRILGGGGRDSLDGRDGDDRILGGAGNDGIVGGAGRDVCTGGPGNDRMSSCEVSNARGAPIRV